MLEALDLLRGRNIPADEKVPVLLRVYLRETVDEAIEQAGVHLLELLQLENQVLGFANRARTIDVYRLKEKKKS